MLPWHVSRRAHVAASSCFLPPSCPSRVVLRVLISLQADVHCEEMAIALLVFEGSAARDDCRVIN